MEKFELEGAFDIKRTGVIVREWEKSYFALNERLKRWNTQKSFTNREEPLEEWECKFVQDVTFGAGKSKGNRLDIYFMDGEKLSLRMTRAFEEETLVSWMVALRRHLRSVRQVTPQEWELVHKKREERLTKQGSIRSLEGSTTKPPKLKDKLATLLSRKNKNLKPSASSPEISPPSTPDKFFAPTSPISSSSQESSSSSFILDSSSSASSSSDSNASAYETLPKSVTPIPLTTSVSVSTSTGSMELTDNSKSKKKLNSS